MLGERSDQRGLWEGDRLYLDHVGRESFYGLLASLRGRLFRDAEFAEFYCPDNGRDSGKLLVRQLEIRGTGMNEVWAGTPVNTAAKLSGVAGPNEVAVSDRVFADYENSAKTDEGRCCGAAAAEGMPAAEDWTWPLMKPSTFGNKTPFPGTWDWISTASTACGSHGVQLTEPSSARRWSPGNGGERKLGRTAEVTL